MPRRVARSYLPLTPATFQILVAIGDGEKHGYAILKDVWQWASGEVRMSTGTLYDNLARLVDAGIIVESNRSPKIASNEERRRYYRVTEFGREVAIAEAQRMDQALTMAHTRKLI
jgi:DNA-binding PadR family transcriptional regulator